MSKLILIKHAPPLVQPEIPADRWGLSQRGREMCTALAEAMRAHSPQIIVSSEELKARETAELVAQRLGIPWETAANLHEHERRDVPHMRSGEFISMIELMLRKRDEIVLGSESADQALARFSSAVDAVLKQHPDEDVAIVSHGTVIALFAAQHSQRSAFELWRQLGLPSFVILTRPHLRLEQIVWRID